MKERRVIVPKQLKFPFGITVLLAFGLWAVAAFLRNAVPDPELDTAVQEFPEPRHQLVVDDFEADPR